MSSFTRIGSKPLITVLPGMVTAQAWTGQVVRVLFAAYLLVVILAHLVAVPDIYATEAAACEPGSCFGGRLNQQAFEQLASRGVSPESYALVMTALVLLIPFFAHVLAAIVVVQRPTDWLALFFVLTFAFCSLGASGVRYYIADAYPWTSGWIHYVDAPVFFGFTALAVLFPDGRFVPRWSWLLLFMPIFDVLTAYRPTWSATAPQLLAHVGEFWWEWSPYVLPICLLYRWRVTTNPLKVRQIKTLFVGQLPLLVSLLTITALTYTRSELAAQGSLASLLVQVLWIVGVVSMLFALFVSVNLDDLFDLQIAFDRTLIYIVLSMLLFLAYLIIVGFVWLIVPPDAGAIAALIAAATIAIAFAPLRARLQRWSQRLFFGERDEPYGFLRRLGTRLDQADSPEALTQSILLSVQNGLRVPGATLAIAGAPALSGSIGKSVGGNPEVATVRFAERDLGTLSVGRRSPGEEFSDQDRLLIHEIARQTGITVWTVMQSEALRHSREQIINAREEERRRLRRDLHDGIGPTLAALSMQIELARDLVERQPGRAETLLEDAAGQIRESIGSIRTIVYDLRPPALDELGLASAVRAYAERYNGDALRVVCDLPASFPPLPAAVEVAAYRIVQEGLTNVARHAGANQAMVRLGIADRALRIEVSDNGNGLPNVTRSGVGLVSMRERTGELGGSLQIESGQGGVRLTAILPLAGDQATDG